MKTSLLAASALAIGSIVLAAAPADARKRNRGGAVTATEQSNTGGRPGRVISRGATGADTVTNNSAAGGNANQPARRIPGGSATGGGAGN